MNIKCKKCDNETRDSAKYCDYCGSYLELNNLKIRWRENKHNEKEALKKALIQCYDEIITKDGINCNIDNPSDFNLISEVIFSYIVETTNISKIFNIDILSENDIKWYLCRLSNVKFSPKEQLLNEFLVGINNIYEDAINQEDVTCNFVFYTNIKVSDSKRDLFNEILSFFNLKSFRFENSYFDNIKDQKSRSKYLKTFNTENEILLCKMVGKSRGQIFYEARNRIYLLFGFLAYMNNMGHIYERWSINPFNMDYSIVNLNIVAYLVLDENSQHEDLDHNFRLIKHSKHYDSYKFKIERQDYAYYDELKNFKKRKLLNLLNEYLRLYYYACNESDLDASFLKFWSLSEKIVKNVYGDTSDSNLIKKFKKILKIFDKKEFLLNRIDFLKGKRNKLVHENRSEINIMDRNVIKLVSDYLIFFIIYHFKKVKNIDEYGIILDNMANNPQNMKDVDRKIELLNYVKEMYD